MRYIVTRSSGDERKPTEDSFPVRVHEYVRLRKDYTEQNPEGSKWFFEMCRDVTDIGHNVLRGVKKEASHLWACDIEDIHEFVRQNGKIVLSEPDCEEGFWDIEIYDSYRES